MMKKTKKEILDMVIPKALIQKAKKCCACKEAIEWLEEKPRTVRSLVKQKAFIEWFIYNVPVGRVYREILHRIYPSLKIWWKNDKLHREDGPACEYADGNKFWYLNGKRHREDGPAIEYANGSKLWYLNDKLHREDGPAIECASGDKEWWVNGKRHREDGPAVEFADGTKEWYLNGEFIKEEK